MYRNFMSLLVVLCVFAFAAQASAQLVAEWELGDASGATGATIVDATGNGHNGTVVGTLTPGASGKFGNAFTFPGGGNYIKVTNVTGLNSLTSVTETAWIYTTTWGPSYNSYTETLVLDESPRCYSLATDNFHSFNGQAGGLNPSYPVASAHTNYGYSDGSWHLFSLTYNASTGTGKVYIDNNLMNTATGGGALGTGFTYLTLGCHATNTSYGWIGSLDDIGIWSAALTDPEVYAIYNTPAVSGLSAYDAGAMNTLFNVYNTGTPASVGSLTWSKVTGLTGTAGSAWSIGGTYYVQLDSSGGGVETTGGTIPEPGTLALLAAGLAGLLCYAWRKRR